MDSDGLADIDLACYRGWLAALRGDAATAETMLAGLADLRASEDPQDQALVSIVEAFTRRRARSAAGSALRARPGHARPSPARWGSATSAMRWAWPLAARAAHDLDDTAAIQELLALLDDYQPGHLAPMLRAERDLVRARLAAGDGDQAAAAAFTAAISGLREQSTPYHLAHGLLDHAEYLSSRDDTEAAAAAIAEARDIAERLGCQPLPTAPRHHLRANPGPGL